MLNSLQSIFMHVNVELHSKCAESTNAHSFLDLICPDNVSVHHPPYLTTF